MTTNVYYCSNCGKHILSDWDDYYNIVQEAINNGGTIEYDKYRYFEGSIMLYEKLTPNATGSSSCSRPFNHFTLNKELYDMVKNNDNYIYLSKNVLDEGKNGKPYSYYGYCPCCGSNLDKNKLEIEPLKDGFRGICGETFITNKKEQLLKTVETMKNRRKNYYSKKLQSTVDKYIDNIERNVLVDLVPVSNKNVDIKEYLLNLINIETSIYSLKKRYHELLTIDEDIKNAANFIKENDKNRIMNNLIVEKEELQKSIKELEDYFNVDASTINFSKYGIYKPIKPIKPIEPSVVKPIPPIFEKHGLFNKSKVEKRNAELQQKYDADLLRYNNSWDEYQKNINDYNFQIQSYPTLLFQYEENV